MPIGAAIGGIGSSIAGGILGGNAAKDAAAAANQAAQQGNDILSGVQKQTDANLQPFVGTGQQANSALAGLLGIGGDPAASGAAFNKYLGSTNYNFVKDQGLQGIEYANAPAFSSGATAKALDSYNSGLAGNALAGYEGQLGTLSGQGVNAAGTLGNLSNANAGAQSNNLLSAAGVQGSADIYGANSAIGALRGVTSGLSSFGSQSGGLSGFGGSGGNSGLSTGYSTNDLAGSLSSYLGGLG